MSRFPWFTMVVLLLALWLHGINERRAAPPPEPAHKNWHVTWTVQKFRAGEAAPYETLVRKENLLLNAGITAMLDRLIGGTTYPAYSNANSYLWVGDGNFAAAATQTALQGTNTLAKAMDATYPQVSGQTVTFRSTFATSEANFTWQECGASNGSSLGATVKLLNRKVTSMGTKSSGQTWTLTMAITIS